MDFEATCDDSQRVEPQEVIEFPIVLVDAASGCKVNEFRTYVRPSHHPKLTAFCKQLTGIEQALVDEAPSWSEALVQAQTWLDSQLSQGGYERCVFVTCGDWDLKTMIIRQCAVSGQHVPERFHQWVNIKMLYGKVMKHAGRGMKEMLDGLGLKLEGHHHSGLDDSRNIAKILAELLQRGAVPDGDSLSFGGGGPSAAGTKGSGKAVRNSAYQRRK